MLIRTMLLLTTLFLPIAASIVHAATAEAAGPSTVTIPIKEYLDLVKQNEKPKFVTISSFEVTGSFGERLKLSVRGEASSLNEKRDFLRLDPGNVSLDGCEGSAQVSYSQGVVSLLPTAPRFQMSCALVIKNWSQAQWTAVEVMNARATVSGAEALISVESSGTRQMTLARISGNKSSGQENLPVAAVGRFRLSFMPEGTRFSYQIEVTNPSRNMRPFAMKFRNGETVSRILTDSEFSEEGTGLTIKLKPGLNSVRIEGAYAGTEFRPMIDGGPHYLLVENHHLLQLNVKSAARRVSAQDAGIPSNFAGQRAYLLQQSETATWDVKKLDVLPSLGFSVESADYNYYMPARGHGIIEATFRVNNQGQPEIPIHVTGRPLYLEVDGAPQVLAKNQSGDLLLQLNPGTRNVYLQYESPTETRAAFGFPLLNLAKPLSVMSQVSARMTFEDSPILLWAQGLTKTESDLFALDGWFSAFIGAGFLYLLARNLGMARRSTFVLAACGFTVYGLSSAALGFSVLLLGVAALYRWRDRVLSSIRQIRWTFWRIIGAAFLACIALVLISFTASIGRQVLRPPSEPSSYNAIGNMAQGRLSKVAAQSESFAGAAFMAPPSGTPSPLVADAPNANEYQGLPAKVVVPGGARTVYFQRGLMEEKAPVFMMAAFLHGGLLHVFFLLALGYGLWSLWQENTAIKKWLRVTA